MEVSAVLDTLAERRLIRIAGRRESVGRPLLYGTTPEFLKAFGLRASSRTCPRLSPSRRRRHNHSPKAPMRRSTTDMTELRRDPVIGRWVIISTDRGEEAIRFRPGSQKPASVNSAPFALATRTKHRPSCLPITIPAARKTPPDGGCASSRTNFRCFKLRGRSAARAKACTTR